MHRTLIACLLAGVAGSASAQLVITGTLGPEDPTFQRPLEGFSDLSGVGTNVLYDTYLVGVTADGTYDFLASYEAFDGFLLLYSDFDPASPLLGGIGSDDDFGGTSGSLVSAALMAGEQYVLVVTAFGNSDAGNYTVTVTGTTGTAFLIPAPGSAAALGAAGLLAARRRRA